MYNARIFLPWKKASMRPPRIAAEYRKKPRKHPTGPFRFNEAAANRGGIHGSAQFWARQTETLQ